MPSLGRRKRGSVSSGPLSGLYDIGGWDCVSAVRFAVCLSRLDPARFLQGIWQGFVYSGREAAEYLRLYRCIPAANARIRRRNSGSIGSANCQASSLYSLT